jgi:hypothetical protein
MTICSFVRGSVSGRPIFAQALTSNHLRCQKGGESYEKASLEKEARVHSFSLPPKEYLL